MLDIGSVEGFVPQDCGLTTYSHHMLTMLLDNKLLLAPINPNPQNVLDVGSGTGIWAMYMPLFSLISFRLPVDFAYCKLTFCCDFADEYPSAIVRGTDLSPIQPTCVPPNLKFEIDDAHFEWTWPEDLFDLVHMRCLMGSIKDWPRLYSQAFRQVHALSCLSYQICSRSFRPSLRLANSLKLYQTRRLHRDS